MSGRAGAEWLATAAAAAAAVKAINHDRPFVPLGGIVRFVDRRWRYAVVV
jgi:hypothetical protein